MKYLKYTIFVFIFIVLFGCIESENENKPIKIAVSNWAGYMPLIYAYEKGLLRDLNIEIVSSSSISTSLEYVKRGLVDGCVATQKEYESMKDIVTPIILLNQSYGGDKILSNLTKDELYAKNSGDIYVHLEKDSINFTLFEYFRDMREWGDISFLIKNNTQNYIAYMKFTIPSIIVTYEPYATMLIKRGLYEIESTKNPDLFVIDALYIKKGLLQKDKDKFLKLKKYIKDAQDVLTKNPKIFYEIVKKYLNYQSYEDFKATLLEIKFIDENKEEIIQRIKEKNIEIKNIL